MDFIFWISQCVWCSGLQCFSKLCDFHCTTVSHSSVWCKSWDKHDFNEVVSLILAQDITIIIYWQPNKGSSIYVKLHSVILTYILILIHFCDHINVLQPSSVILKNVVAWNWTHNLIEVMLTSAMCMELLTNCSLIWDEFWEGYSWQTTVNLSSLHMFWLSYLVCQ